MTSRIRLEECSGVATINLRGDFQDARLRRRLQTVLGCSPTIAANRFVAVGGRTLIWLGPNELLWLVPYEDRIALIDALESAMLGLHVAITDVTGNRVRWRLSGSGARDLLAAGCAIDFHPRAFETGQCVQTLFARSSVTILQLASDPTYELHLRRSFDHHLRRWVTQAMTALDYGNH